MLTRRERTEVLVEGGPALALELASLVEADTPAQDIVPARQGLVMCQVRETARNSRFYLSEVLVTESRVRIGEADGLGVLMGTDAAHARALAVIDAAYAACWRRYMYLCGMIRRNPTPELVKAISKQQFVMQGLLDCLPNCRAMKMSDKLSAARWSMMNAESLCPLKKD